MTYKQFKRNARKVLREQLSLNDYIDVRAASANIRSNIPFRGPNIYILFVAIVIASVGLNVNSIPVIIGAMLISPLMSPIIGFGLGLGTNDTKLLLHALFGYIFLFVFNFVGAWFGVSLEITWLTAIISGVFGVPGVVVLLLLKYIL